MVGPLARCRGVHRLTTDFALSTIRTAVATWIVPRRAPLEIVQRATCNRAALRSSSLESSRRFRSRQEFPRGGWNNGGPNGSLTTSNLIRARRGRLGRDAPAHHRTSSNEDQQQRRLFNQRRQ